MEKKEIKATMQKKYQDRFPIFLAIAIILLAVELFITTYSNENK